MVGAYWVYMYIYIYLYEKNKIKQNKEILHYIYIAKTSTWRFRTGVCNSNNTIYFGAGLLPAQIEKKERKKKKEKKNRKGRTKKKKKEKKRENTSQNVIYNK